MSIRWFARALAACFVVALFVITGCAGATGCLEEATPDRESTASEIVTFSGSIDTASVAGFIDSQAGRRIARVILDSPGGEIRSGIVLANWILDRCADVQVSKACASSCANYLFLAGRRKIIDDGAIVIWHGSALQEDFRRLLADCPRRISELTHSGGELVDRYLRELEDEEARCRYFSAAVDEQNAFFARIGASEYVTRMGQEPHEFRALWTVSPETMAQLGIAQVEAPANYGSHDYMRRFNRPDDPEPILVLGFDDAGAVIERAR